MAQIVTSLNGGDIHLSKAHQNRASNDRSWGETGRDLLGEFSSVRIASQRVFVRREIWRTPLSSSSAVRHRGRPRGDRAGSRTENRSCLEHGADLNSNDPTLQVRHLSAKATIIKMVAAWNSDTLKRPGLAELLQCVDGQANIRVPAASLSPPYTIENIRFLRLANPRKNPIMVWDQSVPALYPPLARQPAWTQVRQAQDSRPLPTTEAQRGLKKTYNPAARWKFLGGHYTKKRWHSH
jgi:hypothetical protein